MGKHYSHSGMGNRTFVNIEPYSTVEISGMGHVTFEGVIGEGSTINSSNMGKVIIDATVPEGVTFNHSGMGVLEFITRPSDSVLNAINLSGMGRIKIPEGNSPATVDEANSNRISNTSNNNSSDNMPSVVTSFGKNVSIQLANGRNIKIDSDDGLVRVTENGVTTVYAGEVANMVDNQLCIDNQVVTEDDPRILHVENAPSNRTSGIQRSGNTENNPQPFLNTTASSSSNSTSNNSQDGMSSFFTFLGDINISDNASMELSAGRNIQIKSDEGLVRVTENGVTTVYAGEIGSLIDNELYIDDIPVTANDLRILHVENAPSNAISEVQSSGNMGNHPQSFFNTPASSNSRSNTTTIAPPVAANPLGAYSPATKAYIDSFAGKETNLAILEELNLSDDDNKLLEPYCDCFTKKVANIPVILYERLYDLATLLKQLQTTKLDPSTQREFTLCDIQPAREKSLALRDFIHEIIVRQERNEQAVQGPKF